VTVAQPEGWFRRYWPGVGGGGDGSIVTDNDLVAACPALCTRAVNVDEPAAVGVPEI
jgi:hypothetical protein